MTQTQISDFLLPIIAEMQNKLSVNDGNYNQGFFDGAFAIGKMLILRNDVTVNLPCYKVKILEWSANDLLWKHKMTFGIDKDLCLRRIELVKNSKQIDLYYHFIITDENELTVFEIKSLNPLLFEKKYSCEQNY